MYRDIFKAIDAFLAPCFSATGMLSAARCMRVLSMTQHVWRLITFRMNENNKPVYDSCAVGSCYWCHELFLPSKHLVSSVLWHGSLYFRALMTPTWNTDVLESVGKNLDVNFVVKVFPADKQFTIWWINLEWWDS
jgi:hypothetical protein